MKLAQDHGINMKRFQVLTSMSMKMAAFWGVMPQYNIPEDSHLHVINTIEPSISHKMFGMFMQFCSCLQFFYIVTGLSFV
jgi:hypothetical protein